MEKVQSCMEEANKKIIGSNGEKLRIVINNPGPSLENDGCHNFGQNTYIDSKDHRSNSNVYASNITCTAIIHEVLHRLGLEDEYQEKQRGYFVNRHTGEMKYVDLLKDQDKQTIALRSNPNYYFEPEYDCRVFHDNSIMSNHNERWHSICKRTPHWFGMEDSEGSRHSLLDRGHFNRILYGECSEKNRVFNECMELSVQNSFESKSCMEKRNWCKLQNIFGRDKQGEIERINNKINLYEESLLQMALFRRQRYIWHSPLQVFSSTLDETKVEFPEKIFLWSQKMEWIPQSKDKNSLGLEEMMWLYKHIENQILFSRIGIKYYKILARLNSILSV